MAERYRTAAGDWSNAAQWDGGTTLPGPGDDCYANNFITSIDQDVTVNSLRTTAGTTAVAGGRFQHVTGSLVITCPGGFIAGAGDALLVATNATGIAIGPSYGSLTTSNCRGVNATGFGRLIGDVYGGSQSGSHGLSATFGFEMIGDSYAGTLAGVHGASLASGSHQHGDSHGGATAGARGTILQTGAFQVGRAFGGSVADSNGTQDANGATFYGECHGGSVAGAYGVEVNQGSFAVPTLIVDAAGKGLAVNSYTRTILHGSALESQVHVLGIAGRYSIVRGVDPLMPWIRPRIHPAFVS